MHVKWVVDDGVGNSLFWWKTEVGWKWNAHRNDAVEQIQSNVKQIGETPIIRFGKNTETKPNQQYEKIDSLSISVLLDEIGYCIRMHARMYACKAIPNQTQIETIHQHAFTLCVRQSCIDVPDQIRLNTMPRRNWVRSLSTWKEKWKIRWRKKESAINERVRMSKRNKNNMMRCAWVCV